MKAIRIHAQGGPDEMRYEDVELEPPEEGEARVRHTAIGVNFIDVYHRSGLYKLASLPAVLGVEAAGVVEAIGPNTSEVAVGDRVAYVASAPGAYAEARNVPAHRLVPLPAAISDEVAAASLLKGMTVEYLIRRTFAVQRGMTVLFHAAAGGVGLLACQWLSHLGATVIGTVSSDEKAELARAHGCHHAIVYTREDFVERVRAITSGAGVPVAYDSVGKTTFTRSLDCLARRGTLVGFGNASGKPDPLDVLLLSQKGSLFLTRPTLFDYTATRPELLASAAALFEVIASGAVKVDVRRRWPLRDAAEAHRALESRATTGSTILVV
jgi:NADPH2:quinone reductase